MEHRRAIPLALCLALSGMAPATHAFVVSINRDWTPSLYLRVGDGVYSGTYIGGGNPGSGGGINRVSVIVPAAALGNGNNLAMTSNATESRSFYDNYVFCNLPRQVYVGGFNRGGVWPFPGGDGTLTVTAPANLTNAAGDTIPFSQISWTSSGNGDTGTQPFPSGAFTGGTQTLASFPVNTWRESCHSFSYGNDAVVAAGTYNGRVTYTLTAP